MIDSIEQEREKLMTVYRNASVPEQAAIKLLAINWGSLSKMQIGAALRKVVGSAAGKTIDFDALAKTNLLISVRDWNGQRFACNSLLVELIARSAVLDGTFNLYAELAHLAAPLQKSYKSGAKDDFVIRDENELIRETRLGMYWRDEAYIAHLFDMVERYRYGYFSMSPTRWADPSRIYAMVCSNPFDAEWFQGLPWGIRRKALPVTLSTLADAWHCDERALALLREGGKSADAPREWHNVACTLAIYRGDWQVAEQELTPQPVDAHERGLRGLIALLRGDEDGAIELFREGLVMLRRESARRKTYYKGAVGLFFLLGLQLRSAPGDMEEAGKLLSSIEEHDDFARACYFLGQAESCERNEMSGLQQVRAALNHLAAARNYDPWVIWTGALMLYRYQPLLTVAEFLPLLDVCLETAANAGFAWLAAEMAALIAAVDASRTGERERAAEFEAQQACRLLMNRIHREEPWERALKAISNTVARPPKKEKKARKDKAQESRLAWYVHSSQSNAAYIGIEAREQTQNAKGGWNKGKPVSLKRLRENAGEFPFASREDVQVTSHIALDRYTNTYYLSERGWLALVGHPRVFWSDSGTPMEVAVAEPELRVKKNARAGKVHIEFWPRCDAQQKIVIARDGLTRLLAIELKPEHHRLSEIIGKGLDAPLAAQDRVLASLSAVSSLVTIHSDIGGTELTAAEPVEASPRPHIQLVPEADGLKIALLVRPFGDQGSYFAPGSGGAGLIAEVGGKRLQTHRDLTLERKLADEVRDLCPALRDKAEAIQDCQWLTPDPENSLEVLLEIHELGDKAVVEWPQGEKYKIVGQAGLNRFSLKLQQQRDWFSVSGELKLDNGEILNMQKLLELTAGTRGKFVRLDENRFLALTEAFRKRLEDLRTYSERHGKEQRLNVLALPVMEEIAEEVGELKVDLAWRRQIERLRQAEQFVPRLPSTLQAELRDYQREGFEWLSRLAAWGVGACLADDMGLGKTLQAIALILSRAGDGPSLVVAPTSVCFNWQNELLRFAPTLNVRVFGAGDRQQLIDSLQPLDLLICSYGLLQQEAVGELLAGARFRTIVLDEAQAIKNPATKRSQQAMALQGEFKLIMTGTPLENHLGELWNLFRFVNPGLLGSLESFNRRFAGPIERNQDREARLRLKKLIQPFILRRTKSQVLDELPPRTEIELQVELSEQEATFYEALRRKLLEELSVNAGPIEDKRFQVLAAITKLRRACCNPELAAPGLGLPSSKLELFAEVLDDLLDNRHKALVFSQFVDHLDIIRRHLDDRKISFQYLDGQTPAAERKKRVEAFQAGQGEVFLISLKAGGVGLNLTAADYVIHMDPWWNPAVEDQASDRAHRIGQHRPVTVYRLVTKGTIEEQIVSLHRQKRDLADSLLEGGEISGKVGAEELLKLMRGE